ncbi:unnamed protein product [Owenia fusiformis]|uniref:Hexosyltransferase n=1 Tax=Owenia fusiformis TaxID=6347 RepID=A0A8J1TDF9_OWEFU|nr:unnamed protein product [Owenia fusiformis]
MRVNRAVQKVLTSNYKCNYIIILMLMLCVYLYTKNKETILDCHSTTAKILTDLRQEEKVKLRHHDDNITLSSRKNDIIENSNNITTIGTMSQIGIDNKTMPRIRSTKNSLHDSANSTTSSKPVIQLNISDTRKGRENDLIDPVNYTAEISNPHDFEFTINENQTCKNDVFLLVYVYTAPGNFVRRTAIRSTWGNTTSYNKPDKNVKVIFLLGKTTETLQSKIRAESLQFKDIIQENFVDSYRNLTYKGVMGLKWVGEYCPNATFALKVDDDVFVNIFSLVKYLEKSNSNKVIYGHMGPLGSKRPVFRDKKNKWYVSREEFPMDFFPQYASGMAYVISGSAVKTLYDASLHLKFVSMEDFYITGRVAKAVNVTLHNMHGFLFSPSVEHFFKQKKEQTEIIQNNNWKFAFSGSNNMTSLNILWHKLISEQNM